MIPPLHKARAVKTLAAGLFALLAGGLAAHGQTPALPVPFETWGGTAWTVADFDGDGRPDIVTARPELVGDRFRHHIEIQLSSAAGRIESFAVEGLQPGIEVAARDVDGDHDIDLVLTTAVSHRPVGVWINNGAGAFARGNDSDCGAPFGQIAADRNLSSSGSPLLASYIPRPRVHFSGLIPSACRFGAPPTAERSGDFLRTPDAAVVYGFLPARAPPALL